MTYEIDVTPANDPLGTILTTLGDGDLLAGTRFRPVKLGSGMVQVVIDADSVKAGALEDEVFLRIRDTVIGSYIYSGSLSNGQIKLVSERKDRRVLTWSGLGALGPLARMTLGEDIYALGPPVQTARGSYDVPGMWTWTNVTYGAVGRRQFEEGRDHPDNPFAGMTCTFDRDSQTGGAPWTLAPTLHQEQVGTNVLDAYMNLIKAGVIFELTPGLVLNAWEAFGSDHSGPAFAADVVRFMVGADALDSAANILTDAERAWSSSRVSELLVIGANNVTVKVNDPTAPFGKVSVYHYPRSDDPAVLTKVGNDELARRLLRTIGALKLPVILEDDPLNGHYLPGPGRPLWPANTVSATTGSAAYDFDAAFPVAALDILLTDGQGWTCEAELGTPFIDNEQRAKDFAVRQIVKSSTPAPHSHPEMLCEPTVVTVETSTSWKVTPSAAVPDGWHEVGFDDSAYANAVNVDAAGWYDSGSTRWIWQHATQPAPSGEQRAFRLEFEITEPPNACSIEAAMDNTGDIYLNGTLIGTSVDFAALDTFTVDPTLLVIGTNVISVVAANETAASPGEAGIYVVLTATTGDDVRASRCGHNHNHDNLINLATGDPHTQYVKESEFTAKGDVLVGTGSGAFDNLPPGTNGHVLTADSAQPLGVKWAAAGTPTLGAWTDYTPAWTATSNPSIGNGVLEGMYKLLDSSTLLLVIYLEIGSTTNPGSGTWKFGLPSGVTVAGNPNKQVGVISILDAGTINYAGSVEFLTGATTTHEMHAADDVSPRNVDHNSPIAWANGDTLTLQATLRVTSP